jgi:hypothetical protein
MAGHTSLLNNEAADAAAKESVSHRILASERAVKPSVDMWQPSSSTIRKEKLLLIRIRTEHTHLTHGNLL